MNGRLDDLAALEHVATVEDLVPFGRLHQKLRLALVQEAAATAERILHHATEGESSLLDAVMSAHQLLGVAVREICRRQIDESAA